jgi:hypothetical protein
MADEEKLQLEWLKFHWDKWKEEATRFWRHLALGTIALIALNLYQLDVLQFNFTFAKLMSGMNSPAIKRWLICPISIWLWIALLFSLVDFLRHRVPEKFEVLVHNNSYPIPGTRHHVDLKAIARLLYFITVVFYLTILGSWIVYCSITVWQ